MSSVGYHSVTLSLHALASEEEEDHLRLEYLGTLSNVPGTPFAPTRHKQTGSSEAASKTTNLFTFILIALLYFVQGLYMGFFGETQIYLFTHRGASYAELSMIPLIHYAAFLVVFLSPLQDTYYSEKFGKRKSYMVPILIVIGTELLILSLYIEDIINNLQIGVIVLVGATIQFFSALREGAVAGFIVNHISKENLTIVSSLQNSMSFVGHAVGFNFFIPLNSVEFCNQYIFSTPHDTPLITAKSYLFWIAILTLSLGVCLIGVHEKKTRKKYVVSFTEIMGLLRKLVLNKNLRLLVLVGLVSPLTIVGCRAIFEPVLIKNGYKIQDLANIRTLIIPIQLSMVALSGYLNKKKRRELPYYTTGIGVFLFLNISAYFILDNLQSLSYTQLTVAIFLQQALWTGFLWFTISNYMSYVFNVAHESTASTFIIIMHHIHIIGVAWPETASLAIKQVAPFQVIYIGVFVIALIVLPLWIKFVIPMQNKTSKDFEFRRQFTIPTINEESSKGNVEESQTFSDYVAKYKDI